MTLLGMTIGLGMTDDRHDRAPASTDPIKARGAERWTAFFLRSMAGVEGAIWHSGAGLTA